MYAITSLPAPTAVAIVVPSLPPYSLALQNLPFPPWGGEGEREVRKTYATVRVLCAHTGTGGHPRTHGPKKLKYGRYRKKIIPHISVNFFFFWEKEKKNERQILR